MSKRKRKKTVPPPEQPPIAQGAPSTLSEPGARRVLGALLVVYVVVGLAAAVVVPHDASTSEPRLTPPDESAHWLYVKELATERRLPVFYKGVGNYEAHQPPLYYLTVLWTYLLAGDAGILWARLWSLLVSSATLLVVWHMSSLLVGQSLWMRLATVGALAFVPGRLMTMACVSNDPMFELWAALSLWLSLRAAKLGVSLRQVALLGVCLGLLLLTKTSGIALAPVVGLALVIEPSWRREGLKRLVIHGLVIAAVVACLWGWWVARNMMLYGEPLALETFQRIFKVDRPGPDFFLSRGLTYSGYWMLVAWQTWMSVWGVFGQATVYMPPLFYAIGNALGVAAGGGLVLGALRRYAGGAEGEPAKKGIDRGWIIAVLLLVLTLVTFMRFNTVFYQAQARYFLGSSPILAAVLALGFAGLSRRRGHPAVVMIPAMLLAFMSVWAVVAYAGGGYSFVPPSLQ